MFGPKWNPAGLHCYVTGGSTGLGLAVAQLLTQHGAHVSIVARDQGKLDAALKKLEEGRVDKAQILKAYSFSLSTYDESAKALKAASEPHKNRVPDALFLCAGAARPRFYIESDAETMQQGMVEGYWVQAWTALAGSKAMVKQKVKGKILFVSSTLGYMSFIGYSTYSPAKQALRGLADTLRSELLLYSIGVHIFFPPTMFTPGYETENKTKPKITLKIEEDDGGITPEVGAKAILKGIQNNQAHIAADLITNLFRSSTRGATPYNNPFLDCIFGCVAWIATPIWRQGVDKLVIKHQSEHEQYLQSKGFYDD